LDRYTDVAEAPREQTFSERMQGQLSNLNTELDAACVRLEKVIHHHFGPRPPLPNATGTGKLQAVPNHASGELLDAAGNAVSRAYAINGLISDLERAL
jgi:hypothetical protein